MADNTTIWTQTNLAQWAEDSNRGSWYKYLQSSKSLQLSIKGKMTISSNLKGCLTVSNIGTLNLQGYLKQNFNSLINLNSRIKIFEHTNINLVSAVKGKVVDNKGLQSFIRSTSQENINLLSYIKQQFQFQKNLLFAVKGKAISSVDFVEAIKGTTIGSINIIGFTRSVVEEYINLYGYTKQTYNYFEDIRNIIRGKVIEEQSNLFNYIKSQVILYKNIIGYTKAIEPYSIIEIKNIVKGIGYGFEDIRNIIKGFKRDVNFNLSSYLKIFFPAGNKNLSFYLKTTIIEYSDFNIYLQTIPYMLLTINIRGIFPTNLPTIDLSAEMLTNNNARWLPAYISAFQYKDLSINLISTYIFNLPSYLNTIQPVNIGVSLHGFAKHDLGIVFNTGFWPELNANIVSIPPKNLGAIIIGYLGMLYKKDLGIMVGGVLKTNLLAYLKPVLPIDLKVFLTPKGKIFNLGAEIKPKIIFMKSVIYVALLEHMDLNAIINYGCEFSTYSNLPVYFNTLFLKELTAVIQPKLATNQVNNLNFVINYNEYIGTNIFDINYFIGRNKDIYTSMKIEFEGYSNVINIGYIELDFVKTFAKNLNLTLNCILSSMDLSAKIQPISILGYQYNPLNIDLSTRRIIIDINKIHEQWYRVVELFFSSGTKENYNLNYVYFDGVKKVFKEDKDRYWTVLLASHLPNKDDLLPQKLDIKKKYLIKLSDYSTIDEAVKYLIDRVAIPRKLNLKGILNVIQLPQLNLSCSLISDFKYKWAKNLKNSIIGDYVEVTLLSSIKSVVQTMNDLLTATKSIHRTFSNLQNRIGYMSDTNGLQVALLAGGSDAIELKMATKHLYKFSTGLLTTLNYYYGNLSIVNAIKGTLAGMYDVKVTLSPIGYLVPESFNLVFNFTEGNYVEPEHNSIEFNFYI